MGSEGNAAKHSSAESERFNQSHKSPLEALQREGAGMSRPDALDIFRGKPPTFPNIDELFGTPKISAKGARESAQINGREFAIKSNSEGAQYYRKDPTGEWNTRDGGNTWVRRGNDFRVWRGLAYFDGDGKYVTSNSDYGLRQVYSKDGSTQSEIRTLAGESVIVRSDKTGKAVYVKDDSGEWSSKDGKKWRSLQTGQERRGTAGISQFGEYKFQPETGTARTLQSDKLEVIKNKQTEIESTFGITVVPEGEKKKQNKGEIIAGVPTLDELNVLNEALTKTSHEDYSNMRIFFSQPSGLEQDTLAYYEGGNETTPHELVMLPGSRMTVRGWDGFEGVAQHELAHHEQYKKWGDDEFADAGMPLEARKLLADMGWTRSAKFGYLIEDKYGGFWKLEKEHWNWKEGTRSARGIRQLDNAGMQRRALHRPPTTYFDAPTEEHAEGVAMFRVDRGKLAQESPDIYRVMKQYDQLTIDNKWGKESTGESKYIRALSGRVIPNTVTNRTEIETQENIWGIK